MLSCINYHFKSDKLFLYVLEKMPEKLRNAIESYICENNIYVVNEIRIHANAFITLISSQKNIGTSIFVNKKDVEDLVICLCDGSIYAHIDSIRMGYISVGKGVRAGLCGKAVLENGLIEGVCDINSVNIRIPHKIDNAGSYIFDMLKSNQFSLSILIYSPPGIGKTTILRDLVLRLSNNDEIIRHAVIDTREEITPFIASQITSDIYLSYPKGLAIELATKSMSPQLIICDEITSINEVRAILLAVHSGVNLIATTHAGSYEELKSKTLTSTLIKRGVFDYAVGIARENGETSYAYTVNKL